MKKQRLREKTQVEINKAKQATFDKLPKTAENPREQKPQKSIILQLGYAIKENELKLQINFKLLPSRLHFSNLLLDLLFDGNKMNSYQIAIPPSRLLSNELEFPIDLDMTGICQGEHIIKVDLAEKWETGEILAHASQYMVVAYSPVRREERLVKVPIVRKVEGTFRIIMPDEKELYENIEQGKRQEATSKRDTY